MLNELNEDDAGQIIDALDDNDFQWLIDFDDERKTEQNLPLATAVMTPSKFTVLSFVIAQEKPNLKVIETLLDLGSDPNAKTKQGITILGRAVANKNITPEIIRYLISRGANPNLTSDNGIIPAEMVDRHTYNQCSQLDILQALGRPDLWVEYSPKNALAEAQSYLESSKVSAVSTSIQKITSAPKVAPPKKKFGFFCIANSDNPDVLEAFEEFGNKITSIWHQETSKSLINDAPQAEVSLYSPKASYIDLTSLQHSVESYSTISYLAKNLLGYDLPILSTTFSVSMHAGLSIINSFNNPWHIELLKTSSFYAKLEISKMLSNQQEYLDKTPVDLSSFIELCGYETLIYTSLGLASGAPILSGISGAASCLNNYNSPQSISTSANAVSILVGGVSLFVPSELSAIDKILSSITNMGVSHIITNAVVNSFYGETTALEEAA